MYVCGNCNATTPDDGGCPSCGGPSFTADGPELRMYRELARQRAFNLRTVGVLGVVFVCLMGLNYFLIFGGDQLLCWIHGEPDASPLGGIIGVAVAVTVMVALGLRFFRPAADAGRVAPGPAATARRR